MTDLAGRAVALINAGDLDGARALFQQAADEIFRKHLPARAPARAAVSAALRHLG